MSALNFRIDPSGATVSRTLIVPRELSEMLDEGLHERAAFDALPEGEKLAMLHYVSDARLPEIRERRAALAIMSLRKALAGA